MNKPEYWCNPSQLLRRIQYRSQNRRQMPIQILENSSPFFVNENETIGHSLLTMGVYDLVVAESLVRILTPKSQFYDVGANIGYFSRIASSLGAQVQSFEPHPQIHEHLKKNIAGIKNIQSHTLALSNKRGSFDLYVPKDFHKNEGTASLEAFEDAEKVKVHTETLDEFYQQDIELLKIDVEGHELQVLRGAENSLKEKRIQYIIFEEFGGPQAPTIQFLEKCGYPVFKIEKTLGGPHLIPSQNYHPQKKIWEPVNYIASFDPLKLQQIFSNPGWQFFQLIKKQAA